MSDKAWFALYTKPRAEYKAAKQLEEIQVSYYLPTVTRIKQWSDRKKKVTEPILNGYIFIFADERERILSLERPSIVRCIFDNGRPAKIPEWQINSLKRMLSQEAEFFLKEGLIPGAKVKIKNGPFEGVTGVIVEADNGHDIAVSIDLLNRSVVAHLPRESIFEIMKERDD
jgi:transcription antitermination factor NusG